MNAVDFTPSWYRQRRQVRSHRRKRLLCASVLLTVMSGWWMVNRGMVRSAGAALRAAHDGQLQANTLRGELEELRTDQQHLLSQLQRFSTIAEHIQPTLILAELSHLLPDDVRLDSFSMERLDSGRGHTGLRRPGEGASAAAQAPHSGCVVSIVAQARDNATLLQFCLNLQNSPLFEFTEFHNVSTHEIGGVGVEQRRIDLYVLRVEHIE